MAEKLSVKITNSKQFERLVHLMQTNPVLARGTRTFGQNKVQNDEQWENFAMEINSFGPPHRTGKEWKRVWINYEAKTKKKMSINNQNLRETGGGPSQEQTLSALEQVVADILHTEVSVNPPGNRFGVVAINEDEENVEPTCSSSPNLSTNTNTNTSMRKRNKKKKSTEEIKVDMLESQTANSTEVAQTLKRIEKNTYKMSKYAEKNMLRKEKFQIAKENMKLEADLKRKKIQLIEYQLNNMR